MGFNRPLVVSSPYILSTQLLLPDSLRAFTTLFKTNIQNSYKQVATSQKLLKRCFPSSDCDLPPSGNLSPQMRSVEWIWWAQSSSAFPQLLLQSLQPSRLNLRTSRLHLLPAPVIAPYHPLLSRSRSPRPFHLRNLHSRLLPALIFAISLLHLKP